MVKWLDVIRTEVILEGACMDALAKTLHGGRKISDQTRWMTKVLLGWKYEEYKEDA